jgi:hypothetical protein
MPFSQSMYMTVVVLNGDTARARGREDCCGGGRINFLTDVPKTISSLRDIQGLQMDVPTDRLCVCLWGGGGNLPPSLKTFFLFLTQPEGTSNDMCISRKNLCLLHKTFRLYQVYKVVYLYL